MEEQNTEVWNPTQEQLETLSGQELVELWSTTAANMPISKEANEAIREKLQKEKEFKDAAIASFKGSVKDAILTTLQKLGREPSVQNVYDRISQEGFTDEEFIKGCNELIDEGKIVRGSRGLSLAENARKKASSEPRWRL